MRDRVLKSGAVPENPVVTVKTDSESKIMPVLIFYSLLHNLIEHLRFYQSLKYTPIMNLLLLRLIITVILVYLFNNVTLHPRLLYLEVSSLQ